jgi:hypothetical protein
MLFAVIVGSIREKRSLIQPKNLLEKQRRNKNGKSALIKVNSDAISL